MSPTATRTLLGLALLISCSGCSTAALPAWFPFTWPSEAERTVRRRSEAREEDPKSARGVTASAERDRPPDPAEVLYRLGLLQADPTSGLRDYRAARATFTHLLSEYPRSRWDAEARAWQATLTDLLAREDEARRLLLRLQRTEEERKRAKSDQNWLRQIEIDQERRR